MEVTLGSAKFTFNLWIPFGGNDMEDPQCSIECQIVTFSGQVINLQSPLLKRMTCCVNSGVRSYELTLIDETKMFVREDGLVSKVAHGIIPPDSSVYVLMCNIVRDSPFKWVKTLGCEARPGIKEFPFFRMKHVENIVWIKDMLHIRFNDGTKPLLLNKVSPVDNVKNKSKLYEYALEGFKTSIDSGIKQDYEKESVVAVSSKVLERTIELITEGKMVPVPSGEFGVKDDVIFGPLNFLIGQATKFDFLELDNITRANLGDHATKMMDLHYGVADSLDQQGYCFFHMAAKHGVVKPAELAAEVREYITFGFTDNQFILNRKRLALEILKNILKNDGTLTCPEFKGIIEKDMKALKVSDWSIENESYLKINGILWPLKFVLAARWIQLGVGHSPLKPRCQKCGKYCKPCCDC